MKGFSRFSAGDGDTKGHQDSKAVARVVGESNSGEEVDGGQNPNTRAAKMMAPPRHKRPRLFCVEDQAERDKDRGASYGGATSYAAKASEGAMIIQCIRTPTTFNFMANFMDFKLLMMNTASQL